MSSDNKPTSPHYLAPYHWDGRFNTNTEDEPMHVPLFDASVYDRPPRLRQRTKLWCAPMHEVEHCTPGLKPVSGRQARAPYHTCDENDSDIIDDAGSTRLEPKLNLNAPGAGCILQAGEVAQKGKRALYHANGKTKMQETADTGSQAEPSAGRPSASSADVEPDVQLDAIGRPPGLDEPARTVYLADENAAHDHIPAWNSNTNARWSWTNRGEDNASEYNGGQAWQQGRWHGWESREPRPYGRSSGNWWRNSSRGPTYQ